MEHVEQAELVERAKALYEEGLEAFRRGGDHETVRALCEEAVPYWSRLANRMEVTSPIHMLAESARLQGEIERARPLYQQSIAIGRESNHPKWVAMELNNMAFLELQAGNLDEAERLARKSLAAHMLSASRKILEDQGIVYDPAEQPLFDHALAATRKALTAAAFEEAWAAGAALSLGEAGHLALSRPERPKP